MSACAAAKFVTLGPVFTRRRPWLWLSLESPVGQPRSEYGAVVATPVKSAFAIAIRPFVGQPIPSSHCAWTRYVLPGSNSLAVAENLLAAYATPETSVRIASDTMSVPSFMRYSFLLALIGIPVLCSGAHPFRLVMNRLHTAGPRH